MDFKDELKISVEIAEVGSRRKYPILTYDIPQRVSEMPRPPLRGECKVSIDTLVSRLSVALARLIGYNWAVGLIPEGGVAVEIGCDHGDGIERMRHSGAKDIIGIDPYKTADWDSWYDNPQEEMDARYGVACERFEEDGRVWITRETSDDFFAGIPGFMADWWFIDGDHREESCYRDICNCFEHTNVGGHICLDDIDCSQWGEGINKALDRFLEETGGAVKAVWRQSSPAVLRRVK